MAKFLVLVTLLVIVNAAPKHHPKFPKDYDEPHLKKVICSNEHDRLRGEIMNKSSCGAPKEVFVPLVPPNSFEQVSPSHVWIKRCVGICDHGSECQPRKTIIRHIPIRIYNAKTDKEACSTYPVKEHVTCGCCDISGCEENRVFNPRKCSCQCPNMEERRSCLRKRNQNMRWNRSKCACEPKRRVL